MNYPVLIMSLNDLFIQILESEQKARERKDLLNELKSKVSAVNQQLQCTQAEGSRLQDELASKVQELHGEELEYQWISTRGSILEEQFAEQAKQKQMYSEQLLKMRASQNQYKEDFLADVSAFIRDFGLTGNGREQRLNSVKEQMTELRARQEQLQEELDICYKQKEVLRSIEEEKVSEEEEILKLKQDIKDYEEKLVQEKIKMGHLEEKKTGVGGKPHSDREFKRLQAELDACRDDSLEGLCQALQQQIDQLQRQQWQQQLQRQHPPISTRQEPHFHRSNQSLIQPTNSHTSWKLSHNRSSHHAQHIHPTTSHEDREDSLATATSMEAQMTKMPSSSKPNLGKLKSALKRKAEEK